MNVTLLARIERNGMGKIVRSSVREAILYERFNRDIGAVANLALRWVSPWRSNGSA